jgi:hypothetical protein
LAYFCIQFCIYLRYIEFFPQPAVYIMRKNLLIAISFITCLAFAEGTKADDISHHNTKSFSVSPPVVSGIHSAPISANHLSESFSNENDSMRSMRGETLFSNEKISISSIYPNPASAYASIDYQLFRDTDNAKIILCNVLGNVVGEYTLIRDAKRLHISTLELNSGVYFYTLSVDGKSLITRKLIIKHHS